MWLVEWARIFAPIAGLAASCWTLLNTARLLVSARRREKLENEAITIVIASPTGEFEIPYKPLRKALSRAELMGVLGMSSRHGRFSLLPLTDVFVGGDFDRVVRGELSVLRVAATKEELSQFVAKES